MKLTINRITLLFGLILFVDFFFFDNPTNVLYLPVVFAGSTALGILNRKSPMPYAYWRGLLVGIRILLLGAVFALILFTIARFIEVSVSPSGSIINSTQESLTAMFSMLPQVIAVVVMSIIPMLITPLFFLRRSKQTNDIMDADLMDNEQT